MTRLAALLTAAVTLSLAAPAHALPPQPIRVSCEKVAVRAANARAKPGTLSWFRAYEAAFNACMSGVGAGAGFRVVPLPGWWTA